MTHNAYTKAKKLQKKRQQDFYGSPDTPLMCFNVQMANLSIGKTGFEIRHESSNLTCAKTSQKHSMRVFSDSHGRFVRLSSSYDSFYNNLLLTNSSTLIFHFLC